MVKIYAEKYKEIDPDGRSDEQNVREEAQLLIGDQISEDFKPSVIRKYYYKKSKNKELIDAIEKMYSRLIEVDGVRRLPGKLIKRISA